MIAGGGGIRGREPRRAGARTGTPRPIVDILRNSTAKALAQPEVKSRLDALGFTAVVNTPEEYGAQIKKDTEIWPKIAHEAGLDPQ